MSRLIEHAKREFLRIGYEPVEGHEDDPNKWIQENVLELLRVFSEQGHTGSSATFAINYFRKLASWGLLGPLKKDDCTFQGDQCRQLSSMFKDNKGCYYLDAIVFRGQNGSFTGSAKKADGSVVQSHQYVKFPFVPKTFYIDVVETEWSNKEETVEQAGGGWWTSVIKNEEQLKEVFEYYEQPE